MSFIFSDTAFTAVNVFPFLFTIVSYVLTSWGLYTFASRRQIDHAWMSWVPVLNIWILGSLSDQYRYVAKGQNKSKRKILLTLNIISVLGAILLVGLVIAFLFNAIAGSAYGVSEAQLVRDVMRSAMGLVAAVLLLLPITIVMLVFRYMALYDLYLSCDPDNAVLFLVLSILVGVTEPFFIFCNRQHDKGMPPRRPIPGAETYRRPESCQTQYSESFRSAPRQPSEEAPHSEENGPENF